MKKNNVKSDVRAKSVFVKQLESQGFEAVKVVSAPADIVAMKDGKQWYFEIKMTHQTEDYFGAATFTEWEQAFKTPDTYRFVVAIDNPSIDDGFEFLELTPQELMKYSTIPPCKVFFNLNLLQLKGMEVKQRKTSKRKSKAIKLSKESFETIQNAFNSLKENM